MIPRTLRRILLVPALCVAASAAAGTAAPRDPAALLVHGAAGLSEKSRDLTASAEALRAGKADQAKDKALDDSLKALPDELASFVALEAELGHPEPDAKAVSDQIGRAHV